MQKPMSAYLSQLFRRIFGDSELSSLLEPPDSGHTDFSNDHKPRTFEAIVVQLSSILLA